MDFESQGARAQILGKRVFVFVAFHIGCKVFHLFHTLYFQADLEQFKIEHPDLPEPTKKPVLTKDEMTLKDK